MEFRSPLALYMHRADISFVPTWHEANSYTYMWNEDFLADMSACGVGLRHMLVYIYVRRGICKVFVLSPLLLLLY